MLDPRKVVVIVYFPFFNFSLTVALPLEFVVFLYFLPLTEKYILSFFTALLEESLTVTVNFPLFLYSFMSDDLMLIFEIAGVIDANTLLLLRFAAFALSFSSLSALLTFSSNFSLFELLAFKVSQLSILIWLMSSSGCSIFCCNVSLSSEAADATPKSKNSRIMKHMVFILMFIISTYCQFFCLIDE